MVEIVLVDDAREDLAFLERVLRQCKILNPIHRFYGGDDTLLYFRKLNPDAGRYLIFIDLIMSPLNGISVLRSLRAEGIAQNCIFVMLSGITDIKAINEGYQLGAHTFLIKPVSPQDILELLQNLQNKITAHETPDGYLLEWTGRASKAFSYDLAARQSITFSN
jgi:CheY-like chemotaxis protein